MPDRWPLRWPPKPWRWLRFQIGIRRHPARVCTCTFADGERYPPYVTSHPGRDCPLATHCGVYSGPCGSCDQCCMGQYDYYEAKAKRLIS